MRVVSADQTPSGPTPSMWQRFLDGKTSFQRLVIALGALAGAVLTIAAVVGGVAKILDERVTVRPADGEVQKIQNREKTADDLVRFLLKAAKDRAPVQLDHQVMAPRGPGGEFRLEYNCKDAGLCNFVRLETPSDIPDTIRDGVWYRGCWSVTQDGAGYAADHLDLELRKQGTACP